MPGSLRDDHSYAQLQWMVATLKEGIEQNRQDIQALRQSFTEFKTEVKVDIATQKVKLGVWSLLAGSIPASALVIIAYVKDIF